MGWFSRLWLLLQLSRGARIATASARTQALSTPKALSKDYIPPREPTWQPWENKTDHKAVVSSIFIICSYCILSLSRPFLFLSGACWLVELWFSNQSQILTLDYFWLKLKYYIILSLLPKLPGSSNRTVCFTPVVFPVCLFLDFGLAAAFCEKMLQEYLSASGLNIGVSFHAWTFILHIHLDYTSVLESFELIKNNTTSNLKTVTLLPVFGPCTVACHCRSQLDPRSVQFSFSLSFPAVLSKSFLFPWSSSNSLSLWPMGDRFHWSLLSCLGNTQCHGSPSAIQIQ